VPNGVDYPAYAAACDEPGDLKRIPHPRIGYTGVLKKQIDWDLLLHLSAQHREWSFVFVGPVASHAEIAGAIAELSSRGNVHFLGAKSVHDLAAYPQHFDVCIMPYQKNDYTNHIYPLKLHEYLAVGKPVVASGIDAVREFASVIAIADSTNDWIGALANAIESGGVGTPRERRRVAEVNSWDERIDRLEAWLEALPQ
jgi:glycosyltransferase involved in cell wall biosynthesis